MWFAAAHTKDRNNASARTVLGRGETLVTTDHILIETWRLLRKWIHRQAAETFWDHVRSGIATLECVTAADMEIAWAIGRAFPDQSFSPADRTSFAVMERLGITRVASFDNDFVVYRYGRMRDKAFTLVR